MKKQVQSVDKSAKRAKRLADLQALLAGGPSTYAGLPAVLNVMADQERVDESDDDAK